MTILNFCSSIRKIISPEANDDDDDDDDDGVMLPYALHSKPYSAILIFLWFIGNDLRKYYLILFVVYNYKFN
jgi:hypothetical protein